jgi:hypothetical protein
MSNFGVVLENALAEAGAYDVLESVDTRRSIMRASRIEDACEVAGCGEFAISDPRNSGLMTCSARRVPAYLWGRQVIGDAKTALREGRFDIVGNQLRVYVGPQKLAGQVEQLVEAIQ